jgi:hypothetical protein
VVGKLSLAQGIGNYKPYQSTGEDSLHNDLGMIGIPIDLHPEFRPIPGLCLQSKTKSQRALVKRGKIYLRPRLPGTATLILL